MSAHRTILDHGIATKECCQKCAVKHAVKAAMVGNEAVNPAAYQKPSGGRKTRVFARNKWGQKIGTPHPSGIGVMPGSSRACTCCPGDGKTGCSCCSLKQACSCVPKIHSTHGAFIRCSCISARGAVGKKTPLGFTQACKNHCAAVHGSDDTGVEYVNCVQRCSNPDQF